MLRTRPKRKAAAIALLLVTGSLQLAAQAPVSAGAASSSRAIQLPPSGRTAPGQVSTTQTPASGGVSTINSSLQVGGGFAGSVPDASLSPSGDVNLTLADAVREALKANLGPLTANNESRASRAARLQALSSLLPNLSANASETVSQVNLAAYGFQFKVPPGLNFSIPSVVGPFEYSQLQGSLSQSVYDPVARRNWRASQESERSSLAMAHDARETVVLAAGGAYLQTLAAAARVESQRAQVQNAQAIYNQAVTRKEAGTNSKLDVMRSLVELQTEQQRLTSYESDLRKNKITLARVAGIPLDRELSLSDRLTESAGGKPELSAVLDGAFRARSDVRAAEAQVRAAELALSAAHAERLPSASINGNYGALGPNPTSAHGVFTVTGSINMPIWQGGRVRGDLEQAQATLAQRRAELADTRAAVEEQIRNALIDWETAQTQAAVAKTNRQYAAETLGEARDRFAAGVATTVEVVQAQQQVATAENDYIESLFSLDLARLSFARAAGQSETSYTQLLTGAQP